jgi:SAM-dependent methyltransferase
VSALGQTAANDVTVKDESVTNVSESYSALSRTVQQSNEAPRLQVIGVEDSHDTLRRMVAGHPPGLILDVPAGQGIFSAFLKEHGWRVHAADIDPGNFKLADIPFARVNLNKSLPFEDAQFDAVSCVNGLHRLLFPEVAIREFARILKPGGRLYININNYSSIWKRIRFLLSGSLDVAIETQECLQTIDDPEANVRLPLMYPRLNTLLQRNNFDVIDVQPAAVSARDRMLRPLAMLMLAAERLMPRARRAQLLTEHGNHRAVIAGGAYIYVEAIRREEPSAARR